MTFSPKEQRAARYRRAPNARAARAGPGVVLLHLDRGTYYTLNETGAFLWERLDGARTLDEISNELIERFEIDPATARSDLTELVDELVAEGLAEPATPPVEGV